MLVIGLKIDLIILYYLLLIYPVWSVSPLMLNFRNTWVKNTFKNFYFILKFTHFFCISLLTSDIHKCFLWTDLIFNFPESVLTRKKVIVVKSIQTVRISFNLKAVGICAKVITETLFNCNNKLPLMTAITGKV